MSVYFLKERWHGGVLYHQSTMVVHDRTCKGSPQLLLQDTLAEPGDFLHCESDFSLPPLHIPCNGLRALSAAKQRYCGLGPPACHH